MTAKDLSAEMRRYVFFFPFQPVYITLNMAQVLTRRVRMQPGLSVSVRLTVVQLNLKPEASLSGLLPTNNEIGRDSWEDVSTIELRGVLSTAKIENIHFSGSETYELKLHVQLHKPSLEHIVCVCRYFLYYSKSKINFFLCNILH